MTNLIEYLKSNKGVWKYVGTIYGGDENYEMTSTEIIDLLQVVGEESPIIDHPATTGEGGGFYFESDDIWFQSDDNLIQECVFEKV